MDIKNMLGKNKKPQKLNMQISMYYALIVLVAVIAIGFSCYVIFYNILLDENIKSTKSAVVNSSKNIEAYMDKVFSISNMIANDKKIIDFIENNVDNKKDIENEFHGIISSDEFIESIILITHDGRIISNEETLTMDMSTDMMKKEWYVNAIDSMPYLSSTRMNEFTDSTDFWVISISTNIMNEYGENLGILLIDINYAFVYEKLASMNLQESSDVFILDENDDLVYYEDTSYFRDKTKIEELSLFMLANESYNNADNTITYSYSINKTGWTLAIISKLDNLTNLRKSILIGISLSAIVILILVLIVSNFISNKITRPVKELENTMKKNELKPIEYEGNSYCYEVESLAAHYNNMIDEINILMAENIEKERRIRDGEIETLTNQINPHFLYNTLDTILWMAEFNDSKGVVDMIKALAQFFRLSLNGGEYMITIEDEIDHARQYLKIQKTRYEDKLNYNFDIDENILEIKIPKIILQPIIENAIYHGIKEKDGMGHIKIKAYSDDDFVYFDIIDDGIGFELDNEDKQSVGVGIKNIDERLKLHYCDECGVIISSKIGEGTKVVLKIVKDFENSRL